MLDIQFKRCLNMDMNKDDLTIGAKTILSPRYVAERTATSFASFWSIADRAGNKFGRVGTRDEAIERLLLEEGRHEQNVAAREAKAAKIAPAQAAAPVQASPASAEPMATDRQIARVMSLAIKNAPGSLELTVEQCRRMTRRQISDLITSLQNQW